MKVLSCEEITKRKQAILESSEAIRALNDETDLNHRVESLFSILTEENNNNDKCEDHSNQ